MTVENGDILRAVAEFEYPDGTIAQNVYHYLAQLTAPWDDVLTMSEITKHLETMYTLLENDISQNLIVHPLTFYKLIWDSATGSWEIAENLGQMVLDVTFLGLDDPFPNQVAGVVTAATNRPKSRGRKFVPGLMDASADGSDLVSSAVAALTAFAVDYITDVVAGFDGQFVSGVVRTAVEEFLPFVMAQVNSVVGTQRRRKPGVGA